MQDSVRLYISPFTPDLLHLILPSSLRSVATDISFHELPTFPERNYGYVNLPAMEAQQLRKKVNGSILRGSKVKVEEARSKKAADNDNQDDDQAQESQERRARKRKRQEGVIPAYELKDERKVKRGWTEPASAKVQEKRERKSKEKGAKDKESKKTGKKRQEPSAYTEESECLFKTEVPPNKKGVKTSSKTSSQKKKSKQKATVVHEFERTEKHPSFLRSSGAMGKKPAAEYDEEKGWVDESGALIEPKKTRSKRQAARPPPSPSPDEAPAVDYERLGSLTLREQEGEEEDDDDATSPSGTSSSDTSSDSSSDGNEDAEKATPKPSISVSPAPDAPFEENAAAESTPPAPHPLEALYKKPPLPSSSAEKKKTSLSVDPVPFSFFNSDENTIPASAKKSVETVTLVSPPSSKPKRGAAAKLPSLAIPPQTPFTQRDMMWRAQRSAAPTPDTALPGRGFPSFWGRPRGSRVSTDEIEEEDDDEVMASVEAPLAEVDEGGSDVDRDAAELDDDEDLNLDADDTPIKGKRASTTDKNQSSFAREFYEKRGEFNRSWKQARREAGKAQRAAANRQRKG